MSNGWHYYSYFIKKGDQVVACDLFYNIIREVKKARPLMVIKEGKINIYKFHKEDVKKSNTVNNKKYEEIKDTAAKKNNNANNSQKILKIFNQMIYVIKMIVILKKMGHPPRLMMKEILAI